MGLFCSKRQSREMNSSIFRAAVVGATLLLPACAFTEEALWPSLTGEDPAGGNAQQTQQVPPQTASAQQAAAAQAPSAGALGQQPPLGTTDFTPPGVTPGQATGTSKPKFGSLRNSASFREPSSAAVRSARVARIGMRLPVP